MTVKPFDHFRFAVRSAPEMPEPLVLSARLTGTTVRSRTKTEYQVPQARESQP